MATDHGLHFPSLQQETICARSESNTIASLTSLPPELIQCLFLLLKWTTPDNDDDDWEDEYAEVDSDEYSEDNSEYGDLPTKKSASFVGHGWADLANTCTWTRSIALQTPDLWTHINCNKVELALCFFKRAADLPLSLLLSRNACLGAVAFLNQHFTRACKLDIYWPDGDETTPKEESQLIELLNGPCPLLQHLSLTEYYNSRYLQGTYDNLKVLTIKGGEICPEPSDPVPHFPVLRDLTLECMYMDDGAHWLIDFLKAQPSLESIRLIKMDGPVRHGPFGIRDLDDLLDPQYKLELPNLKTLTLNTDLRSSAVYIRIFSLPSSHLSIDVAETETDTGSSGIGDLEDSIYEHEIVTRARAFWKVASGKEDFMEGRFVTDLMSEENWVTWSGEIEEKDVSVFVNTPLNSDAAISVHDCTVLQWNHAFDRIWEPLGSNGPVLEGVRKIVLYKPEPEFFEFQYGVKNLRAWLVKQRKAGRPINVVEFKGYKRSEEQRTKRALDGLGVDVMWSS